MRISNSNLKNLLINLLTKIYIYVALTIKLSGELKCAFPPKPQIVIYGKLYFKTV